MTAVLLVARREITTRLRQKGYVVGVAVLLVVIAVGAALPKIIKSGPTAYDIAIVGNDNGIGSALTANAHAEKLKLVLHKSDLSTATSKVRKGDWDAALVDADRIITKSSGSTAVTLIQNAHRSLQLQKNLTAAGLTSSQIDAAFTVPELPLTTTAPAVNVQRQVVSTIAVVFLFAQLIAFCSWVGIGVVEEKSSRVVELIISAIRPFQLLLGKLLGIGFLAVAQVVLMATVALAIAVPLGSISLPSSTYISLATAFIWFAMGFAFFASLAAGLASLVSRSEEVSSVMLPVTGLLMVSYGLSFGTASAPDSSFGHWVALIPPVSSIAMPARMAASNVPLWQVLLAALLLLASAALALVVAARLYRASILSSGSRLSLRTAWQGEAVADVS